MKAWLMKVDTDHRSNNNRFAYLYAERPEPFEIEDVHAIGVEQVYLFTQAELDAKGEVVNRRNVT